MHSHSTRHTGEHKLLQVTKQNSRLAPQAARVHTAMSNINLPSRGAWAASTLSLFGAVLALGAVPKARMGLAIVRSKAKGSLPDVGWTDLFRMVRSGAHFNLLELARTPNPYAVIRNPYNSIADVAAGSELFRSQCATCHGPEGSGGAGGPNLQRRQMVNGSSDWALFRTVSLGMVTTSMPASNLPWLEKWRLVAYLRSLTLRGERPADSAAVLRFTRTQFPTKKFIPQIGTPIPG
jgi:mono/diheme cytochrome c family protein